MVNSPNGYMCIIIASLEAGLQVNMQHPCSYLLWLAVMKAPLSLVLQCSSESCISSQTACNRQLLCEPASRSPGLILALMLCKHCPSGTYIHTVLHARTSTCMAAYIPEKQYSYLYNHSKVSGLHLLSCLFTISAFCTQNAYYSILVPVNGLHASRTPQLEQY